MTQSHAMRILARARSAQPAWAALDARRKSAVLGRLRRAIAAQCEPIAMLIARETSKPLLDALAGDVMVTLEMLRYYQFHTAKILRAQKVGKPAFFFRGARFETHFEPHGVALIFGASNYPFQLSMVPAITALAAGNAVVLKCSERTPETAALIADLCIQADLPPGLVHVSWDDPEQSAALIDARPDVIFFTGSSDHGRMVAERAARHLIPVILELGGKDASLVFADCHMDRAVEGITYGAFSNAGQVCVGVKRLYVEASIHDEFVARLKLRMARLNLGPGGDADFGPLSGELAAILRTQVEDALARGATLYFPLNREAATGHEPMLLTHVPPEARILREECFGPVLCATPFADEAEAIRLANQSEFALSSSVWTHNRARALRVARQISAGSCAVNDVIRVIANPHAAFGGNQRSGYGRYHGPEGLRAFSRIRTILLSSDRRKREINWFPFTARTRQQLAGLLRLRHATGGLAPLLSRWLLPLLLCTLFAGVLPAQSGSSSHLTVNVRLPEKARGYLAYLIFDSPSGFPGTPNRAIRHGFLQIPAGAREMRIETCLPPGVYAVSVYEDVNSNHKLDHNFLGIPNEPVGASNNPRPHFGPPRFDECSFRLGTTAATINITLVRGI